MRLNGIMTVKGLTQCLAHDHLYQLECFCLQGTGNLTSSDLTHGFIVLLTSSLGVGYPLNCLATMGIWSSISAILLTCLHSVKTAATALIRDFSSASLLTAVGTSFLRSPTDFLLYSTGQKYNMCKVLSTGPGTY